MGNETDNPFASPHSKALVVKPAQKDQVDWFANPVRRGILAGAIAGAIMLPVCSFNLEPYLRSRPPLSLAFELSVSAGIGAAAGGTVGGISGILVGAVAAASRRFSWRTKVHLVTCLVVCPVVYGASFWLLGVRLYDSPPENPVILELICLLIGFATGIFLFDGLFRLASVVDQDVSADVGTLR
ncbi:hypothetical protein [Blastopirellula marina]|uniref:Uncharacterized protein n=1 Tax=Blastopirellula marina TaxID=124 RepID=A0A2S8F3Y5_9BACT|nr:hypothetical protein [Blastopirellula marina]PQO26869.1 hypothetical protein C5Y98_29295 [Blastopirellula marina]PQO41557.1 hypothetical protein C5Y93_31090 [Blastopirellula marina]PTL41076.1 hypothetical protein C5Y97_29310 [Blastopirellula marina]